MPKTVDLKTSFNAGVLDPRLASRTDINKYYSGVQTALNCLCTPQGGLKRRPGMSFVHDIGEAGRLAKFAFNTEQTYLLVFADQNVEVFRDGSSVANVTTPWVAADLAELKFTQSADTMILVHEDYAPRSLVRGATHSSWTLSTITFTNIPQFDFNDTSSPSGVDEVQRVTVNGAWTGGEKYKLELGGYVTEEITFDGSSTTTNEANIRDALRALENTSSTGITVAYVAASSPDAYDVTFGGSDGETPWPTLISTNIGAGPVTVATQTEGVTSAEDSWSSTRGYPRSVTFHQGRLVFGGTRDRVQTLYMSVTNDFYNFDVGTGLDDQAIVATIDTDQVNQISAVISTRNLQIFTSGGEFVEASKPATPGNVSISRQTQYGSNDLQPVAIDGATLFVERRGKAVREFVFQFGEDAYTAPPVSILAPHLISSPVDLAARKGTSTDDANLVFVVNDDGTMAVLNTLRSEDVAGWTPWETAGEILSVAVVVDEVYFLVKRTINSVTEYYLEQWDASAYTDAAVVGSQAASATVSGLAHLDGEACRFKADGAIMADVTPSSGSITAPRDVEDYEVGLDYTVEIETLPLNQSFSNGPTLTNEKRVYHVQLDVYETLGLVVGANGRAGKRLPDRTLDGPLPNIPDPHTGMKEIHGLLGWSHFATVTVNQPDPLPMFIRSLAANVEVSI